MSSIKNRIQALETSSGGHSSNDCLVFAGGWFGMASEEKQVEVWRGRNPGIEPKIVRVELVSLT
jgi:hypothetical protein